MSARRISAGPMLLASGFLIALAVWALVRMLGAGTGVLAATDQREGHAAAVTALQQAQRQLPAPGVSPSAFEQRYTRFADAAEQSLRAAARSDQATGRPDSPSAAAADAIAAQVAAIVAAPEAAPDLAPLRQILAGQVTIEQQQVDDARRALADAQERQGSSRFVLVVALVLLAGGVLAWVTALNRQRGGSERASASSA